MKLLTCFVKIKKKNQWTFLPQVGSTGVCNNYDIFMAKIKKVIDSKTIKGREKKDRELESLIFAVFRMDFCSKILKCKFYCKFCRSTIPLSSGLHWQRIHWYSIAPMLLIFVYLEMYIFVDESTMYYGCIHRQKNQPTYQSCCRWIVKILAGNHFVRGIIVWPLILPHISDTKHLNLLTLSETSETFLEKWQVNPTKFCIKGFFRSILNLMTIFWCWVV